MLNRNSFVNMCSEVRVSMASETEFTVEELQTTLNTAEDFGSTVIASSTVKNYRLLLRMR